jgi:hypothetical protein
LALVYVPGQLIVPGNATATADHLRSSGYLLRLGIGAELLNACLMIFAVIALYRLFKGTSRTLAQAMAALLLLSFPITLLNLVNELAALIFVGGADFLAPFSRAQLDALAYMFMRLHTQGLIIAQIFWGLWLFPYGIVAIRSRLVPTAIGVIVMIAGYAYVANSFVLLFLPRLGRMVSPLATALEAGEIPIILWLIWGVKEKTSTAPTFASSEPVGVAGVTP